ncbi:MAG TPA: ATPase, T2SS/T4P/T4SS family [Pyrinomonadaceae bacterium]|nr:ATPase, T2SS/T4P/T4SS family [Pyrinomonadaceae bacterium]
MADEKTQVIKVGEQEVFLVLADREGSDFTFYLRNDDDEHHVNHFLRRASGERDAADAQPPVATPKEASEDATPTKNAAGEPHDTEQAKAKLSPPKQNYSCRVHILKTLLDKKDLLVDAKTVDAKTVYEVVFLQKLLEVRDKKLVSTPYALIEQRLPDTSKGLSQDKLADKNLVKKLIRELNNLLKSDELDEFLTSAGAVEGTEEEEEILKQVKDDEHKKLSRYFRFCSLFNDSIKPLAQRVKVGRGLAGLSYEGKIWSLSFREQESGAGYEPDSDVDGNLNSIEELCNQLYEEIFQVVSYIETAVTATDKVEDAGQKADALQDGEKIKAHRKGKFSEVSGLIVISGSTNSAKSLITRGLIHLYLENVNEHQKPKRLPHLVTFEDPIEKYFANHEYKPKDAHQQLNVVMSAAEWKIDYTPRQQEIDSGCLQDALRDALRQTPKVFFVGETRLKEDWKALVDFAATGHLVITTAHAGSLIEAMHKIFLALEATTPAARNEVASRLLAVVHLKRMEIDREPPLGVLVPALWRRVPRGLNALTSEGLASVLPHSHSDDDDPCSCLGRRYFVNNLMQRAQGRLTAANDEQFKEKLTLQATNWDLQGA